MQRALQLAEKGHGSVSPNPMVGCVIVHQNQIIGEGWHQNYGQAHAEVNAVAAVQNKALLAEATAYVTLEPCSHFGKTPPCADLLIKHKLKQVIICNQDPNPLVAGNGILKLQNANIEVISGILETEGRVLNRRFFRMIEQKRPYVILKFAETQDGFMAEPNYQQVAISSAFSKLLVHRWRAEEDAIMIGKNTAKYDNPKLNVREWGGKNPVRVLIDRDLGLDNSLHVFDDSVQTICYNQHKTGTLGKQTQLQVIDFEQNCIPQILADLHSRQIQSLLVEGGPTLLQSFIDANLYDEIRILQAPTQLHTGIASPILPKNLIFESNKIGVDVLKTAFKQS